MTSTARIPICFTQNFLLKIICTGLATLAIYNQELAFKRLENTTNILIYEEN